MKIKLLTLFCLLLTSCASFTNGVGKASPYFRSSAAVITSILLSKAGSDQDKENKAQIVLNVAIAIETITAGSDLSVEAVSVLLDSVVPNKEHWEEFVAPLVLLYADFYAQTIELRESEQTKVLLDALNKIASGCKIAAQAVLK